MFTDPKTDTFKITGSSALNSGSGSLKSMREVARILVAPPDLSRYGDETTADPEDFFSEQLDLADTIIVDGEELRGSRPDSAKTNTKVVLQKLLALPVKDPRVLAACIHQVHCLNWDTTLFAALNLLSSQYQLDRREWKFELETPCKTPTANFKVTRQGLVFTFDFFSTVYKFCDPSSGRFFKLDNQGNIVKIPTSEDLKTTAIFHPVCTVHLVATLDLSKELQETPRASLEITVQSRHRQFCYAGTYLQHDAVQLENRPMGGEGHRLTRYRGGLHSPTATRLSNKEHVLQMANIAIGRMIEIICQPEGDPTDSYKQLDATVKLFHYALLVYLLEELSERDLKVILSKAVLQDDRPIPLSELIDISAVHGYPFLTLLKSTAERLVLLFSGLESRVFAQLLAHFFNKTSSEIYQSIIFLLKNDRLLQQFSEENQVIKNDLKLLLQFLRAAILTIKSALKTVKEKQRYEMVLGFSEAAPISSLEEILPLIREYLRNISQNETFRQFVPDNFPMSDSLEESTVRMTNLPEADFPVDESVPVEVVHMRGQVEDRLALDPRKKLEEFAALIYKSPLIEGLNDGGALANTVWRYLSLDPDARVKFAPYIWIPDVAAGTCGAVIGVRATWNPNTPPNHLERIWKAVTNGLLVGIFGTSVVVVGYLAAHPETVDVSDALFWGQLAPFPLMMGTTNSVWYSLSPQFKERWFPKHSRRHSVEVVLDCLTRFFRYAGIIDITLLNILQVPGQPIYLLVPAVPALLLTLGHYTRFSLRLEGVMTCASAMNFLYLLIQATLTHTFPEVPTYIRLGFWLALLMFSAGVTLRNSVTFVQEFKGEPELIVRRELLGGGLQEGVARSPRQLEDMRPLQTAAPHERTRLLAPMYERYVDSHRASSSEDSSRTQNRSRRDWGCTIV